MSATPIPRTLEMAVTGIREMSTLATPPEDRHPILTFVGPYSTKQVGAAIRRELLREGQVFYVHNRVSSINRVATELAEIVPEARIAVAHGQLPEHVLEQVMVDFWERKFDVLVSTTIIETGLDIANANTLIIDRADKYGLSQLHQLRGRVGRGAEQSFCVLLTGDKKTPVARERLGIMEETTDGFRIAEKDLEIRGQGEILGTRQSGVQTFKIGNIIRDLEILEQARKEAEFYLTQKRLTKETSRLIDVTKADARFRLAGIG